jgi:hypothetical protein
MAQWTWAKTIVFLVPFVLILAGVLIYLSFRKTIRSRLRVARQLRDDPDINEWLVVFGWSRKVLYLPTILASIVLAILAYGHAVDARILGGIWLAVFFLNFLIDEYEMSVKVLLIGVLVIVVLFLWLGFLGWILPFLGFFKHLDIELNGTAYVMIAAILAMAVGISWLKGMFYYVAITPNYLNIQIGPTETGEQVSREEYSTRIDTGDFLERLLGFGRIVITFSDQRRQPMMLLVGRIGKVAAKLESIRGKLALDRHQPSREGISSA